MFILYYTISYYTIFCYIILCYVILYYHIYIYVHKCETHTSVFYVHCESWDCLHERRLAASPGLRPVLLASHPERGLDQPIGSGML